VFESYKPFNAQGGHDFCSSLYINRKELFAVHQAIKQNHALLARTKVLIQSDNNTVVAYIQNQGGTK